MSKYTTELRFICESKTGLQDSVGFNSIDDVIEEAIPYIFPFDFPIFDETYRPVICTKIIRHYYTREISEETFGLWQLRLETKMNEIMPYYNKLYESELIHFNPLYDTDLTTNNSGTKNSSDLGTDKESHEENRDNTVTRINEETRNVTDVSNKDVTDNVSGSAESDATSISAENNTKTGLNYKLYSDTPQGGLVGVDQETYLTNATKDTISENNQNNDTRNDRTVANSSENRNANEREEKIGSAESKISDTTIGADNNKIEKSREHNNYITSTDEYITTVQGKSGGASYSKLLEEFRKTFLNIDLMIIKDLSDLFFNLW